MKKALCEEFWRTISFINLAAAAVAQLVKLSGLRSLKRGATELTRVRFLVVAWELGKNPTIYEANMEESARFVK